ncbi:ABC transporter permease [Wukongibacter sp. M2B1]|uniref:ABC transporter permease n=1 Tax=Wukongibacter sp. M2B1 TaxID=3088895 RepID=UPI003D78CF8C
MSLLVIVKMSIKEIMANKLRSILTMLGVIIGVLSVVLIISIGKGATESITADLEKKSNVIDIQIYSSDEYMDYGDTIKLYKKFNTKAVSPVIELSSEIKYSGVERNVMINGVDESFKVVNDINLQSGRFIAPLDVDYRSKVAVINDKIVEIYFKDEDPMGKDIKISGDNYEVVGIIKESDGGLFDFSMEEVYIPITTAQRRFSRPAINRISVVAYSKDEVANLSNSLNTFLSQRYPDKENEKQFRIVMSKDTIKEINKVTGTLSLMLGGIAAISLLVGGIGIMNIMFVSVSERTREIGIRKAIGAQRRNILTQFLIEASVVSGVGGLIGILLAVGINSLISIFTPLKPNMSLEVVMGAFLFSLLIGIVFGVYPADKASKLKPIDALRYE